MGNTSHGIPAGSSVASGRGQDGFVEESERLTAVKFFDSPARFHREGEVYRNIAFEEE